MMPPYEFDDSEYEMLILTVVKHTQKARFCNYSSTLSYLGGSGGGGGKIRPLLFFLHHPKTVQGIQLKFSDFKDTSLRHIYQVKSVRYILSCYHGNKITEGTTQDLALKESEKSAICKGNELNFDIGSKFGPLSSKTNVNLQFDVIMTFLTFRPFADENTKMTSLLRHASKFPNFKIEIKR